LEGFEVAVDKLWTTLLKRNIKYEAAKEIVLSIREFIIKEKSVTKIYNWFREFHWLAREEENFDEQYGIFICALYTHCSKKKIINSISKLDNDHSLNKFDQLLSGEFIRINPSIYADASLVEPEFFVIVNKEENQYLNNLLYKLT
jgi:hypothetical protein